MLVVRGAMGPRWLRRRRGRGAAGRLSRGLMAGVHGTVPVRGAVGDRVRVQLCRGRGVGDVDGQGSRGFAAESLRV